MFKILIMTVLLVSASFASEVHWENNLKDAVIKAKKLHKPILFISSRHTCKYCVILEKTTLEDPRVVKALNKDFISVVSYSDDNDYLPRELWRPGTPAIWFLKSNGEPMYDAVMGAIGADKFLYALGLVKEEFNKNSKKGK